MKHILLSIIFGFSLACFTGCMTAVPSWDKCTKSSNWHGPNANMRLMNILSPHMSDSAFNDRVNFMKSRECNTAHVFLTNKADGEYAGYSIYGNKFDWNIDKSYSDKMLARVKQLRKAGFGVILWMVADDSTSWSKVMISNPQRFVDDVDKLGFFKYASTVVIGLEVDEYWSATQCVQMYKAVKSKYNGKVGVHQVSGKYDKASTCDIAFVQLNPGQNKTTIQKFIGTVKTNTRKPVNMFELERQENREKCYWAFEAGAYGVGNY